MRKFIPYLAFIGVALVSLLIGAGSVWYLKPSTVAAAPAAQGHDDETAIALAACPDPHDDLRAVHNVYTVKDRVVNLADAGARRYLKASLALEIAEPPALTAKRKGPPSAEEQKKFVEEFGHVRGAQVQDALTTILSTKRTDELALPEGRDHLRAEIKAKLNGFLPKDQQVTKVLLTDFIIQ